MVMCSRANVSGASILSNPVAIVAVEPLYFRDMSVFVAFGKLSRHIQASMVYFFKIMGRRIDN